MLHLYDLAHNKIEGLNKYKDYKIERTLDGIEFLSFSYPFKFAENIKEETYIRTKKNEYVVKEIDDSSEWVNIVAKINLDEIKGKAIDRVDVTNTSLVDAVNLAIAGTGYTATILGNKAKRRTVRKAKCSSYEVLEEIRKMYKVEYKFDTINKVIYIYDSMGEDKGSYFSDELNLRKLSIKSNTYDFATRIIPIGKDGLTIESVNNGKNYVENYQYSNKIIEPYWEDNRYTDAESLKEDATLKLDEISKRVVAYDTDIIDLANASKDKRYKVLDYNLGDTVTLKSREKKVKEKQRIVKITEYPDEPWLNSCEIANRVLKFEDMQQEVIESAKVVDNITNSDGSIDGNSIDEIKVEKIKNFEAEIIRVTNLDVVNANISNLVANKADIVDLNAATARIGTLEVTKATITDLNAANAKITTLEADTAKITDLNATNAKINILEVDSASIQNLLAGNITASNMQSGSITAGSGIIADGAIGSAAISSLDVTKLNAGIMDTSKITVQGANGRLKIHNNLLQVFSGVSGQFERVALGDINKDGTEYGLRIRGTDGTTVLLNENGLTNKGFTDGYEKLADSQLDPKKIDIDKVVTTINNGVTQINSSKIQVGNKTLDVELSEQKIKTTENSTNISKNIASITANTNQIALKLDSQTFNSYKTITDGKVSNIETNLSKATTNISVMQGEINLKASKTEVSTVSSKIDNIKVGGRNYLLDSKTLITNRAHETVDYLGLDGVVKVTSPANSTYITPKEEYSSELNPDEEYVLSVLFTYIGAKGVHPHLYAGRYIPVEGIVEEGKFNRVYIKTKPNQRIHIDLSGYEEVYLTRWKIEKGNVATDWTPAPEDTLQQIEDAKTYAETKSEEARIAAETYAKTKAEAETVISKAHADNIVTAEEQARINDVNAKLELAKVDAKNKADAAELAAKGYADIKKTEAISETTTIINSKVAEIKLTTDSIKLDVSSNVSNISKKTDKTYVDGQISTVNTNITNVSNRTSTLETSVSGITARVSQTEQDITTVDSKVDNIEIGGRNLLLDSKNPTIINSTETTHIGVLSRSLVAPFSARYINPAEKYSSGVKAGETYTFSFMVTFDGTKGINLKLHSGTLFDYTNVSNWENVIEGKFTKIWVTKTATSDMIPRLHITYDGTGNLYVTEFKVEQGNKATDWSPAPEDIDTEMAALTTRVHTAEQKITPSAIETVVSNKFATKTDVDGVKSRVSSAESSITQQADQIASKVNKNGVISEINQTSEVIKINASKINLVGAVTVLSDLTSTNNLGTVNAGRLYGPNIDVNLNAGTIDITNGAFRLKNNLGQVIIDGNSKMFRIAREMTLTVDAGTSNDYTGNWRHHLGYVPAFVAYQTGFPSGSGLSGSIELPAMSVGIGTAQTLYIGSMLRVSVNETNVYVNYIRSDRSKYSRYATVKIYLYSEALI